MTGRTVDPPVPVLSMHWSADQLGFASMHYLLPDHHKRFLSSSRLSTVSTFRLAIVFRNNRTSSLTL